MHLVNVRTQETVASDVELAVTRKARNRGLLGRERLDEAAALMLAPCCAIHTAFMRFAIDVVFVDRAGCVLRVVGALPPWRMAISPRAHAVIELAAGRLRSGGILVGDYLHVAR